MTEITRATQQAWRRHLGSEAGVAGMLRLREATPFVIPSEGGVEFQAGIVEGWRRCLDYIPNIIAEPNQEAIEIENR